MVARELNDAWPRELGTYGGKRRGPLFFVVGGIHGNEPAGVEAERRVLARLQELAPDIAGRVVFLIGNRRALAEGRRYVDQDLNRLWLEDALDPGAEAGTADGPPPSERAEARDILRVMKEYIALGEHTRVVLLDLHSTSAEGAPFSIMSDTIQNRVLALRLPIPVVLGLEERVAGTLLSWFSERGHSALCVEGGQNEDPRTIEHHETAIWVTLCTAGCLKRSDVPEGRERMQQLRKAGVGLPRVVELRYRHGLEDEEPFEMLPGYRNFYSVARGQVLARTETEEHSFDVRAPSEGILVMPRYQGQGNDGFFLGREVRRVWLRLSRLMRRLKVGKILPLLPGIRKRPGDSNVLDVDIHVARWFRVEILHLCGYRQRSSDGSGRVFVRRPDDFTWARPAN